MSEKEQQPQAEREPAGLGEHRRGPASEYAHQQGWSLNEDQRTREPEGRQPWDGGRDYDYGARDFGDTAVDTSAAQPSPEARKALDPSSSHKPAPNQPGPDHLNKENA